MHCIDFQVADARRFGGKGMTRLSHRCCCNRMDWIRPPLRSFDLSIYLATERTLPMDPTLYTQRRTDFFNGWPHSYQTYGMRRLRTPLAYSL